MVRMSARSDVVSLIAGLLMAAPAGRPEPLLPTHSASSGTLRNTISRPSRRIPAQCAQHVGRLTTVNHQRLDAEPDRREFF